MNLHDSLKGGVRKRLAVNCTYINQRIQIVERTDKTLIKLGVACFLMG